MKQLFLSRYLAVLVLLASCSHSPSTQQVEISGRTMGTTFSVKVVKDGRPETGYADLENQINTRLKAVNRQMSTYLPDAEISIFNQYRDTSWFSISADFARVMATSLRLCRLTGGALDITVGPLVNLWGFGPEQRPTIVPDDAELQKRKAWVGFQKVQVRQDPPAIKKLQPGVFVDLSATAKGFGVDKITEYLDSLGFGNYFVEIGGETRALGENAHNGPWRLGVASAGKQPGIQKVILLDGGNAVATSGDYNNYYEMDGVRYSHTIDPRTGKPITHALASVTVVSDDCLTADGLATGINVMGPEAGYQFAEAQNLAVFMIVRSGEGFEEKMTPAFEEILKRHENEQ